MAPYKTYLILTLILSYTVLLTGQLDADKTYLKDQVIPDDLIVDGSSCVGLGCLNGELFGKDVQRYKEDNLRIHFDDTRSDTGGFPNEDWRIVIALIFESSIKIKRL